MATSVTMKRYNGSSFDTLYPVADYNTLLNKPSAGGEYEWEYVGKFTGTTYIDVTGLSIGQEYKCVVEVQTTTEDNSAPYIYLGGVTAQSNECSYLYSKQYMTAELTEVETHSGDSRADRVYTGLDLGNFSSGTIAPSTVHNCEFILRFSPYVSSPGVYTMTIDGWGSTHYVSQAVNVAHYDGMVQSRFTGAKHYVYQSEFSSIRYYHAINAGSSDYGEIRLYKRVGK